jgi:hypothetical protein
MEPQSEAQLAIRRSRKRGQPFGGEKWTEKVARRYRRNLPR